MDEFFRRFAKLATDAMGSPWSFVVFLLVFAAGFFMGSAHDFSEEWGLWMHIGIATITFFLALIIQNTENRHSRATHLKLDEIIRAIDTAKNTVAGSEELPEKELERNAEMVKRELKKAHASPPG